MIEQELQKLSPDALVMLYELRPPSGVSVTTQYFTASANGLPITFNGQVYQPWALQAEGWYTCPGRYRQRALPPALQAAPRAPR